MGEGGRRKRGGGVSVTGMLREGLVVTVEAEEVRMIRLSGMVSVLGLRGRWTITGGDTLGVTLGVTLGDWLAYTGSGVRRAQAGQTVSY